MFFNLAKLCTRIHSLEVTMAEKLNYKTFDKIITSEQDARKYRGLLLDNGMRVLLVSDPSTDKSAAAMEVNVGKISSI